MLQLVSQDIEQCIWLFFHSTPKGHKYKLKELRMARFVNNVHNYYFAVSEKADLVKQVNDLSVLKDDLTLEASIILAISYSNVVTIYCNCRLKL